MNKNEKEQFLRNGGTLIRTGKSRNGQPIIKQRTAQKDWHERIAFLDVAIRDKTFKALLTTQSAFFKTDEL
jgi:hypothetical protein